MAQVEGQGKRCSLTLSTRTASDVPRGLPWEIWQLVFSHLSINDLGHASQVCKTWNLLIKSLDGSRWRELYLQSAEWKLPHWPLNPDARPLSWRDALKEQMLQTRFWYHGNILVDQSQCLGTFRRHRGSFWRRKTIVVGREGEHDTLKSALAVANDYDRILVKPGIYDEQFEMSSKIPLELVGDGELGSVILVMCVEQTSITGRLCNLVIRAPWFTSFALKVKAGYIQVDNCIIEDSLVLIQNPGSGYFRFCTFRHANVIMQHVNVSVLENCEFSQCDLAAVSVEGFPKDEVNWAHGHMTYITAIGKETVCKDNREEIRSRSSLSARTKTNESQEIVHGMGFCGDTNPGNVVNDDGMSVSSSTINRNVRSWLNNLVETGSQVTLRNDYLAGEACSNPHSGGDQSVSLVTEKCDRTSCIQFRQKNNNGSLNQQLSADELLSVRSTCFHCSTEQKDVQYQACDMCSKTGEDMSKESTKHAGKHKKREFKADVKNYGPALSDMQQELLCHTCDAPAIASPAGTSHVREPCLDFNTVDSQIKNSRSNGTTAAEASRSHHSHSHKSSIQSYCSSDSARMHSLGSRLHRTARFASSAADSVKQDNALLLPGFSDEVGSQPSCSAPDLEGDQPRDGPFTPSAWFGCSTPQASAVTPEGLGTAHQTCGRGRSQAWSKPIKETVRVDVHRPPAHLVERSENLVSNRAEEDSLNRTIGQPFDGSRNDLANDGFSNRSWDALVNDGPADRSGDDLVTDREADNPGDGLVNNGPADRSEDRLVNDGPADRSEDAPLENLNDPAEAEFLLNDLSSEDSSEEPERDDSSTLTSSSDEDTFSHSETSLSGEEMLVRMSYPHHHRALLTRKRNSTQLEMATASKQLSAGERATLRSDGMMELWEDTDALRAIEEVQGVTIRNCRMNNGKGGVMVSCQGHAKVIGCHIANMGYGIRCVQNSRALVLKNEIRHCRTSGIFMRLAASGVIAGNDIHSNMEAGIDVRKNADPIIQGNQIHHGERFGVAVLCSGQGQIRNNDIFANAEAGIYILYRGNPLISDNRLMKNQAAGISVNENGLGMIKDNMISGNMWAGVYIRYGGDPFVQNNVICNGVADGVVVGEKGRGTISKNSVTGNAGCGVWIMGGECPLLHGNTISDNGDAGIAFVTNTPISTDQGVRGQGSQGHSPASLALQDLMIEDDKRETKPHYTQTKVVHNTICHNTGHGISVESGKDVFLGSNSIYGNSQSGIYINHPKLVTVHNNHITCNQQTGVSTSGLGQTTIFGNGVFDNKADGIRCQNEAVVKENDVINIQSEGGGIALKGTSVIKVEKNRVHTVKDTITLMESVSGIVHNNQIFSNIENPIATGPATNVKVVGNQIITPDSSSSSASPPPLPWQPRDPASRPDFQEPGDLSYQAPARYVRSFGRVTGSETGSRQRGSRTCILL